ncbi:MAG: DinB family protein [Phototrophicaceae bacterium]
MSNNKKKTYRVGLESVHSVRWTSWLLDLPGCCAVAGSRDEALESVPVVARKYTEWMQQYGLTPLWDLPRKASARAEVVQAFEAYPSPRRPSRLVRAFFDDDRRPLSEAEVGFVLRLLSCIRQELLHVIEAVPPGSLATFLPDDRFGSINGLLGHIATTEWMLCDRLHLAIPSHSIPDVPLAQLEAVRANTLHRLPELTGDDRVIRRAGELWSARKVVRRLLWHERKHTAGLVAML